MTKQVRHSFQGAIRICYMEARQSGSFTVPGLTETVMQRFPESLVAVSDSLLRRAIDSEIRSFIRKQSPMDEFQQVMDLGLEFVGLPDGFSLPPEDVDPTSEDAEQIHAWVSLGHANRSQIELHIEILTATINRNQQKLFLFQRLLRRLNGLMANEAWDAPITGALQQIMAEAKAGQK